MLRTNIVRQVQPHRSSPSPRPSKQRSRLPVPPLRHTLDRYLASLEPLLLEDEKHGGMSFSSAYALRQRWADEFEHGIGAILQERLIALDKVSPHNWLDDNFWINKAYLEWRAPLLVNSNWWLAFQDDQSMPSSALSWETNNHRVGTTFWQLRRASWLLHRMLSLKDNVIESRGQVEGNFKGEWFFDSVEQMFNVGRIPKPICDAISDFPPLSSREARSILLMLHDWCYSVVVYERPSPENSGAPPKLLPPAEIETRLRAVVLDVEERLSQGEKALPVGLLSADDRDIWAKNLQYLLELSPTNQRSHQAMLHAVMGVSLEHTTYVIPPSDASFRPRTFAQRELDSHLHSVRGTSQNVSNRFFDKTFTLIVDPSTHAGAMGEHSPVDALIPAVIGEYAVTEGLDPAAFDKPWRSVGETEEPGWERLDWIGDDVSWKACEEARGRADAILVNSDDSVMWFERFGGDWIKSVGIPPDAFVQLAMQLAWYKTRGEFTATYETVLTRIFQVRPNGDPANSQQGKSRLVLSMLNKSAAGAVRFKLLRDAAASHTRRTREAMTGRGIDRHLLGLQLLLRPLHDEKAMLFEDAMFKQSTQWKLSTSGLLAGPLFKGTGFGSSYEDGYGINYLIAGDMIKFGIESKHSSPVTSTAVFQETLSDVLTEMQNLCCNDVPNDNRQALSHL